MILVVLAGLCALTVPLFGGRLSRLADLQLRGLWIPVAAVLVQVLITMIIRNAGQSLDEALHIGTYVLIAVFLGLNRRLPGMTLICFGVCLNVSAIVANGGVMPAAATAQRIAGLHPGGGFHNSAHLAHPLLPWLGDIIPWPGPLPNVLSVGDCVIFAGTLVLLHRVCSARRPAALVGAQSGSAAG